jgi:hypothetical protein
MAYLRTITIANASGGTITNAVVRIALTAGTFTFGHTAGTDFRVFEGNTAVSYWRESYDAAGQTGALWVKIPSLTTSGTTLDLYYGSGLSDLSNIDNVMLFGDDFDPVAGHITAAWVKYIGGPVIDVSAGTYYSDKVLDCDFAWSTTRSRYEGLFTGYKSATDVASVGYAYSADGKTWTVSASPVLTPISGQHYIQKARWVLIGSTYYVYCSEVNSSTSTVRLVLHTATDLSDGATYTRIGTIDPSGADDNFFDCPAPKWDGTTLTLLFSHNTTIPGEPKYISYFTTTTPLNMASYTRSAFTLMSPAGSGTWYEKAIGGGDWDRNGLNRIWFNAFNASNVSKWGYIDFTALSGALDLSTSTLVCSPTASTWDASHCYRPNQAPGGPLGDTLVFYNGANGSTERIGYVTYDTNASIPDPAKWNLELRDSAVIDTTGGVARVMTVSTGTNASASMMRTASYNPPNNVVIEVRQRVMQVIDGSNGQVHPILMCNALPFPGSATTNQFVFGDKADSKFKHQSRNSGSWGTEDQVTDDFSPNGTWRKHKAVKLSTGINWYVTADDDTAVGSLVGNTDVPTNFTNLPLAVGGRGTFSEVSAVFVRPYYATEPTATVNNDESNLAAKTLATILPYFDLV